MTDLPLVSTPARLRPRLWFPDRIAALYGVAAVAVALGFATALAETPTLDIEWQLALLLRFMAVVKASMVCAALGLTHWRFRRPIGAGYAAGFIMSLAAMLVAPGLIWSLRHVAAGAMLFHAGLIVFLLLAWKDDAVDRLLALRARPRT